MSDIELACHTAPWGKERLIHALSDIERSGFRGIELTAEVVEQFEDRVGGFNEILTQHRLELTAITAGGSMWPGLNLDEEVERGVNIARFLKSAGAKVLVLYPPRPNPDSPLEDEQDLLPVATAYGEIARRTLELGVQTCLHPEADSHVHNPKQMAKFIHMADPEAMKICLDNGFLAEAKVPMAAFIKEQKKNIGLVHLKDLKAKDLKPRPVRKGKTPQKALGVELGKGELKLQEFVELLLDSNYSGWITVEFGTDKHKSLQELARACHLYAEQHLDLVL